MSKKGLVGFHGICLNYHVFFVTNHYFGGESPMNKRSSLAKYRVISGLHVEVGNCSVAERKTTSLY